MDRDDVAFVGHGLAAVGQGIAGICAMVVANRLAVDPQVGAAIPIAAAAAGAALGGGTILSGFKLSEAARRIKEQAGILERHERSLGMRRTARKARGAGHGR